MEKSGLAGGVPVSELGLRGCGSELARLAHVLEVLREDTFHEKLAAATKWRGSTRRCARRFADYASRDSSQPATHIRSCRRVLNPEGYPIATSPKIGHTFSRNLAVIGIRLLDDAHMTWVAAEVECGHALRAWLQGAPSQRTAAFLAYRAAVDREEAAARDLQRLSELTQPYQERLMQTD